MSCIIAVAHSLRWSVAPACPHAFFFHSLLCRELLHIFSDGALRLPALMFFFALTPLQRGIERSLIPSAEPTCPHAADGQRPAAAQRSCIRTAAASVQREPQRQQR
eukprot:scaffold191873_cov27-Tisochrysis_lutea.AAC.1